MKNVAVFSLLAALVLGSRSAAAWYSQPEPPPEKEAPVILPDGRPVPQPLTDALGQSAMEDEVNEFAMAEESGLTFEEYERSRFEKQHRKSSGFFVSGAVLTAVGIGFFIWAGVEGSQESSCEDNPEELMCGSLEYNSFLLTISGVVLTVSGLVLLIVGGARRTEATRVLTALDGLQAKTPASTFSIGSYGTAGLRMSWSF